MVKMSGRAPDYNDIVQLLWRNGICNIEGMKFVFTPWPGTEIHLDGNRKYRIYKNGKLMTDDEHPGVFIEDSSMEIDNS